MKNKVAAPAIALLVVAILSALFVLLSFFTSAFKDWFLAQAEKSDMPPEQLDQLRQAFTGGGGPLEMVGIVLNVVGVVLIAIGALRMKNLQSYGLAVTASILAMIPCTSGCCCIIGLPIGLWALIVLMDKDVKAAFGASTPPPL